MVRAALRRLAIALAVAALGAVVIGLAISLALKEGVWRGVAIGFYLVGIGLCSLAFLLGSRPPVRSRDGRGLVVPGKAAGSGVRWASREEHAEAINVPTVFLTIGFCLILIGIAVDSQHS
jgi:Na+-translocating ferredoxin:NAD+ oxidoreductase RnfE subunit